MHPRLGGTTNFCSSLIIQLQAMVFRLNFAKYMIYGRRAHKGLGRSQTV